VEKVDRMTGIELFAKFAGGIVKYSIIGGYVFFASVAHIINKLRGMNKDG